MTVTVVIPHIVQRVAKLKRALASVHAQTLQPDEIIVMSAERGECAASVRNRALKFVQTTWIAWLDDDDELLPHHLETLLRHTVDASGESFDVVYPACRVLDAYGQIVPMREEWGRPGHVFDPDLLRRTSYIPITSLCRTQFACEARFDPTEQYEDWGHYRRTLDLGGRFLHVNEVTWVWHHDGWNTSGRPDKGDALR